MKVGGHVNLADGAFDWAESWAADVTRKVRDDDAGLAGRWRKLPPARTPVNLEQCPWNFVDLLFC